MILDVVCPECKNLLIEENNKFRCSQCGREYNFNGKSYDFMGDSKYYWGEIPSEEMDRILDVARVYGWEASISQLILKQSCPWEYFMSNARVDFLFDCIDYANVGTCLDIGSGFGGVTFGLVNYYKEVWSLDAVLQRINFQKIRQQQEHVKNIKFVRCDWMKLPFRDNSFDLVVANDVLEWVGLSNFYKNPRDLQIEFLQEIRRVLKPDGCVYIGIENRFKYTSFAGAKDHSNLPFTNILPRHLADSIIRITGSPVKHGRNATKDTWKDYRTYTYSMDGYSRLLRETNYADINFYWSSSYNLPRVAGKFDDESFPFYLKMNKADTANIDNIGMFFKYCLPYAPNALLKYFNGKFCKCFLIFAYKKSKPITFESTLLTEVGSGSSFLRICSGNNMSGKINYFVLKGSKPVLVVKFLRDKTSKLELEEKTSMHFNHIKISKQIIETVPIHIEPALKGLQLRTHNLSHNEMALQWLIGFQNETKNGYYRHEDLDIEINELVNYLISLNLQKDIKQRFIERMKIFFDCLKNNKIPITSEHGDFWSSNILIERNNIYVIDWEFYKQRGNPLFDFVFFLLSNLSRGFSETFSSKLTKDNIKGKGPYFKILKMMLLEYSKATNMPPEIMLQAFPYVIIRNIKRTFENHNQIEGDHYLNVLITWDELCLEIDEFKRYIASLVT